MLDREMIDHYAAKLNWVPYDQRFLTTTEPEEKPDPRAVKHGTGKCRICGFDFPKMTKNSAVCQSSTCRLEVHRAYVRKCRTPEHRARQNKKKRDARRAA